MEGGIDLSNGEEGSGDEADLHDDLEVEVGSQLISLMLSVTPFYLLQLYLQ